MRAFGYDITVRKAAPPTNLSGVDDSRGWFRIFDWRTGAWQQDAAAENTDVRAQVWVFACMTQIASDFGKLRLKLVAKEGRIWRETDSPAYSPVLRRPNHYQTRQQFCEWWMMSKLGNGNAYGLKQRDGANRVRQIYVLDPNRVQPLVAPDGAVYYRLAEDDLNKLPAGIEAVPASEIIHDRMPCLYHPLVGVTPLFAATLPAQQALKIQSKSKQFFENNSTPGGILTAPGKISDETAKRIKDHWERNYTGDNVGKIAVLGDSLAYTPGAVNAVDSQLVEQLGLTAQQICAAFGVPAFMVGAADTPPYGNIGPAIQQYYNQCLQSKIESFEACMDEGLGIGEGVKVEGRELGTELDLDGLLRMDKHSQAEVEGLLVQRGITSPDEAREMFGRAPVKGGDKPYLQQQNYSLEALARRDAKDDPFAGPKPPIPAPSPAPEDESEKQARRLEFARLSELVTTAHQAAEKAAALVTKQTEDEAAVDVGQLLKSIREKFDA
jgi:HK97 family phage portal protein